MKGYWIAHVTVTDPARYADYQVAARDVFGEFGGVFLARGGNSEVLEGPEFARHVLIEFSSLAAARACYTSEAYRKARQNRDGAAITHVVIVEGQ